VMLPRVNRQIPIVADEAVDTTFGTGAVKITPAHDPVDFEVAQRQGLELINILNSDATMNENAGPYNGLERFACRKAILEDLGKEGLLVKIEPYSHAVGHCQRCHTIIEPIASHQWFVKMQPLAEPAIEAVTGGRIKIIPPRFKKVYLNWMENIRDWCISRQLWWGHRIPVWYCNKCGEIIVSVEDAKACQSCGSADIQQDPDVLDTWFSSGLWPHSTLGWPDDTGDLRYFYPTAVMETAYDILFFWVARMIMMGLENTGEIPFRTVYLHGLIRDEKGEKMSKTRGNVLDPLDFLERYGTDALRFALISGTSPGSDSKLTTTKFEAGRNFANKLWNATRFVLRSAADYKGDISVKQDALMLEDRWILSRMNAVITTASRLLKDYQFGEAQRQIHDFLWGEYCDWYIELAKSRLNTASDAPSPLPVLVNVLEKSLRLLHPFMPFITEEMWQNIKNSLPPGGQTADSIMITAYPKAYKKAKDVEAERAIDALVDIVRAIRNTRAEHNVEANHLIDAQVYAGELNSVIFPYAGAIQALAKAKAIFIDKKEQQQTDNSLVLVLKESEVVIPMASMVDIDAEKQRLQKEIGEMQAEVNRLEKILSKDDFLKKAPPAVVGKEKTRLLSAQDSLGRLQEHLKKL